MTVMTEPCIPSPYEFDTAQLIRDLPAPMLICDNGGKIAAINEAAHSMLGEPDKTNLQVSELFEDITGTLLPPYAATDAPPEPGQSGIFRLKDSGGGTLIQVTVFAYSSSDVEPNSFLLVLQSTVALRTLEAKFVHAQKMQTIGQLAGGIAHDFNNLLTAISGHCDLLLLRTSEFDDGYSELMEISDNAHRAAALVGQLLSFSRKQTWLPQSVNLRAIIAESETLLRRLAGAQNKISFSIDTALPAVLADRSQLQQLIVNLIMNARDALPNGGNIQINIDVSDVTQPIRHRHGFVGKGVYAKIEVRDDGIGIKPNIIENVFEPFFTTKRAGEGSGLGLSTAYGIATQSGGRILIDSAEGDGTVATVFLPIHEIAAQPIKSVDLTDNLPPSATRPGNGKYRLLLVEDEEPVRVFAARALELEGIEVIQAATGDEALELVQSNSVGDIDIILSDVVMPGLDGPSWVNKALVYIPQTPVVFMSGYTQEAFASENSPLNAANFLPKPFSLNDLYEAIYGALESTGRERSQN